MDIALKTRLRRASPVAARMLAAILAAACLASGPAGYAQQYPTKPIRMVVPFPPGGFSDVFARIIGARMTESWGQQVAVDNRPGAGGNIKELIALARAKPGELTYASAGAGTTSHLAGELFKSMTKGNITHVPYKGNAPAITDLLSGQTSMLFATLPTVLPQVQATRLRGLAVLGATRSPAIPEMPTLAESGLKGFEVNNWTGVFAPAGTPAAVVSKLNAEIVRIMQLPEVQARLPKEGLSFTASTPQQFAAFVKSEKEKWGQLVKAVGAKVD